MIERYFAQIEATLQAFPNIRTYTLRQKVYNARQGYLSVSIRFQNGTRLDVVEVKDSDRPGKVKYRYQYMDAEGACIFRYDNAPHHRDIETFRHHKHVNKAIQPHQEPTLFDVLLEIAQQQRA